MRIGLLKVCLAMSYLQGKYSIIHLPIRKYFLYPLRSENLNPLSICFHINPLPNILNQLHFFEWIEAQQVTPNKRNTY